MSDRHRACVHPLPSPRQVKEAWAAEVPSCLPVEDAGGVSLAALSALQVPNPPPPRPRSSAPRSPTHSPEPSLSLPRLRPQNRRWTSSPPPSPATACSSSAPPAASANSACNSQRPKGSTSPQYAAPGTRNRRVFVCVLCVCLRGDGRCSQRRPTWRGGVGPQCSVCLGGKASGRATQRRCLGSTAGLHLCCWLRVSDPS